MFFMFGYDIFQEDCFKHSKKAWNILRFNFTTKMVTIHLSLLQITVVIIVVLIKCLQTP